MNHSRQEIRGGKYGLWLISEDLPVNFAMTMRIRGAFSPDQFQRALDKVRLKYPSATTRVMKEADRSAWLISDPNLRFPFHILERQHPRSWVDQVEAELPRPFDACNEPPIRLIWLRGDDVSEIILLCNHAFADGLSGAYVARDLLSYLGHPDMYVEPSPPSTAMSELVPAYPGRRLTVWRAKRKAAFLRRLLADARKEDTQWKAIVEAAKRPYCVLPWELTLQQTACLVEHSRSHGTTVHAALCAAFLRAFGEFYGDGWKRRAQSPVDLRRRLASPVGESFGLYINLVEFSVDCAPERGFWEVAREARQSLERHSSDKPVFSSVLGMTTLVDGLVSVITPMIVYQSLAAVEYDLSISNLGRLDFPTQYGSLQLEALYGPTIGCNPKEVVLGVTTIGDKMHLTMTFTDKTLTQMQAEGIIEKAMRHLADAARW